jgi:hypothetical protein
VIPAAVSPNRDYGSTPASFTLSESALECDNALSSTLTVDGVPCRRDCKKRQVSQGKRRREDFTQVMKSLQFSSPQNTGLAHAPSPPDPTTERRSNREQSIGPRVHIGSTDVTTTPQFNFGTENMCGLVFGQRDRTNAVPRDTNGKSFST